MQISSSYFVPNYNTKLNQQNMNFPNYELKKSNTIRQNNISFGSKEKIFTEITGKLAKKIDLAYFSKLKNKKGELLFKTPWDMEQLEEIYDKYPNAVKELLKMKDKEGNYRFGHHFDLKALAEPYTKYPNAIKELIARNEKEFHKPCGYSDLARLAEPYSKDPEGVADLIKMYSEYEKSTYSLFEKESDYWSDTVQCFAEPYRENPDMIKYIFKMASGQEVRNKFDCDISKIDPKYVNAINELSCIRKDDSFPSRRFVPKAIYSLLDTYINHPDIVKELGTMTSSRSMYFLFDSRDIVKLTEWCLKYPDSAKKAINSERNCSGGGSDGVIRLIQRFEEEKMEESNLGKFKFFKF